VPHVQPNYAASLAAQQAFPLNGSLTCQPSALAARTLSELAHKHRPQYPYGILMPAPKEAAWIARQTRNFSRTKPEIRPTNRYA